MSALRLLYTPCLGRVFYPPDIAWGAENTYEGSPFIFGMAFPIPVETRDRKLERLPEVHLLGVRKSFDIYLGRISPVLGGVVKSAPAYLFRYV